MKTGMLLIAFVLVVVLVFAYVAQAAPITATGLSVPLISYSGNESGLAVTVFVKNNFGQAVSGAEVHTYTYLDDGSTAPAWQCVGGGYTDRRGRVRFNCKTSLIPGSYITIIKSVSYLDLAWDGITPSNSFTFP